MGAQRRGTVLLGSQGGKQGHVDAPGEARSGSDAFQRLAGTSQEAVLETFLADLAPQGLAFAVDLAQFPGQQLAVLALTQGHGGIDGVLFQGRPG